MESNVQIAIIGGFFSLGGYFIGAVQKTFERYMGQKHFQSNAIGILRGLRKDMDDVEHGVSELNRNLQGQKSIMKELLNYSRQHADAALQMARIVENFIDKSEREESDGED